LKKKRTAWNNGGGTSANEEQESSGEEGWVEKEGGRLIKRIRGAVGIGKGINEGSRRDKMHVLG